MNHGVTAKSWFNFQNALIGEWAIQLTSSFWISPHRPKDAIRRHCPVTVKEREVDGSPEWGRRSVHVVWVCARVRNVGQVSWSLGLLPQVDWPRSGQCARERAKQLDRGACMSSHLTSLHPLIHRSPSWHQFSFLCLQCWGAAPNNEICYCRQWKDYIRLENHLLWIAQNKQCFKIDSHGENTRVVFK